MEIELYSKMQSPLEAIDRIGEMFAKSGMFGCDRTDQGKILAMICLAERKSPVEITRSYDIVDGKLRKKALAALGEFRNRGGKHRWIATGEDGKKATLELTYDGQTITTSFTIEDAGKQNLLRPGSNWIKTPGNMLRARCISNGIAMIMPEIYAGEGPEDAAEPAPAAPLLPPQPATKPAQVVEVQTVPATEPKPVNIVVLPAPAPAPEPTTPAPTDQPAEPNPFGPADVRMDPTGKRISDETIAALENAIGADNAISAIEWLKSHKWITNSLADLNIERARRILDKPAVFVGYVKGGSK